MTLMSLFSCLVLMWFLNFPDLMRERMGWGEKRSNEVLFWLVLLWCDISVLCSWQMFKMNTFLNVFFGHSCTGNIQLHLSYTEYTFSGRLLLTFPFILWLCSFTMTQEDISLSGMPLSHRRLVCCPLWSRNSPNTYAPLLWQTQEVWEFFTWPPHLPLLFDKQGR